MTPISANLFYHRRSIRLPGYDYSEAGSYFVTLVAHQRERLFGQVVDGEVVLSEEGKIVQEVWSMLPVRFPLVETDCHVIMPDHFHAIITIKPSPADELEVDERKERQESRGSPDSHVSAGVWAIHELPIRGSTKRELPIQGELSSGLPIRGSTKRELPIRGESSSGLPIRESTKRELSIRGSTKRELPARGESSRGESSSGVPLKGTADVDRETIRKTRRLMLLPKVIGYFKMNAAKRINILHQTPGAPVWLRNYYEHIIRNEEDYERIWDYIDFNPQKWKDKDKKR